MKTWQTRSLRLTASRYSGEPNRLCEIPTQCICAIWGRDDRRIRYRWLNVRYAWTFSMGATMLLELEQPAKLRMLNEYRLKELGYSIHALAKFLMIYPDDLEKADVRRPAGLRLVVSN